MDYKKLVEDFLELQNGYSFVRRTLMTKERFCDVAKKDIEKGLDLGDDAINETLIEHVGHLPIMAAYFYPYLEHKDKVDLGRSLIMLSLHDIGETKLGDVFAYTKTELEEEEEVATARELIHPELLLYFEEYEARETYDARYAKAVDALAPLIREIDIVHLTFSRFKRLGANVDDILNKKQELVMWDETLKNVFDLLIAQARAAEAGESLPLSNQDYDLPRVK